MKSKLKFKEIKDIKTNKVLFIVPPYITFNSFMNPSFNNRVVVKKDNNYGSVVTDMPIGLLSLSAYLKKHIDLEIKLLDFNITLNKLEEFKFPSFKKFFGDTFSKLDYSPEIIGISTLFTPAYQSMLDIAKSCKEIFPNSLVIAGGSLPTNIPKKIFKDSSSLDALCYGEGEKPLLGLMKADNKSQYLKENSSWITRKKIKDKQSFEYDFIENLDEIPFYDYDILNISEYELSPTIKNITSFNNPKDIFYVSTSRGCPYHCCFCSSHTIHGRKMRYHSINRVKEDFKKLKERYGAKLIVFQDDNFMVDKQRAFDIINTLKELKLNVFFQSGLPLYALDKKMLKTLKGAGVNQIVLPVESGSKKVLKKIMHKPINLSIIKNVVSNCRQLKIDTDANILIGLPGETKKDIEDTRKFLKNLDATWFRTYVATPLVGSEMFDICIKRNYLQGDYLNCDFKKGIIKTEDFTPEYIQEKAYSLNLELNFVGNSDFRLRNYKKALEGFENTIRVKSDHAFAYYFASKCCKVMGLDKKYLSYKSKYNEIIKESKFWRNYVNQFGLTTLNNLESIK